MSFRTTVCALGAVGALTCLGSTAQAQVMVVGGGPYYGTTVVVGRPVVPAVAVAPVYAQAYAPAYAPAYGPAYSVGYAGYSTYRPVVQTYVAPAPVVTYRPAVPVYPAYRPGVVTTRAYYPGQPVRNALRVIAP